MQSLINANNVFKPEFLQALSHVSLSSLLVNQDENRVKKAKAVPRNLVIKISCEATDEVASAFRASSIDSANLPHEGSRQERLILKQTLMMSKQAKET